jgi:hypothetical protein
MPMLLKVLATEFLKLRRTLALWSVFLAPFVVVLLHTLIGHFGAAQFVDGHRDYGRNMLQNITGMWTVLMMPLFITLETSLLAGLEHTDKNWKNLLALPAPRWSIYLGKLMVALMLLWAANAVLVAGTIASAHMLMWDNPALFPTGFPVRPLLVIMAKVSVAVMLGLTIQHWVSLKWQSFTAAFSFGMTVMIVGFIAVNSNVWGPRVPWSMPMYLIRASRQDATTMLLTSFAFAAIVAIAGCWEFSRRDVVN